LKDTSRGSVNGEGWIELSLGTKWAIIGLLVVLLLATPAVLYLILLLPAEQGASTPLLVQLKRTLVNIVDEDKLEGRLKVLHPVLPPDKQSRYQLYVTPGDAAVASLANQVDGARDAYGTAVQWIWVSEQTMSGVPDNWLMPHEFLGDTPLYPGNPVRHNVVSDCEEQANTLVSLLRAEGVGAEDVRVVLGKVNFDGEEGGHAWVEMMHDEEWLSLDPSSGPYWDDEEGKLVRRAGTPFKYFSRHDYPQVEVWAYYNDIYYLDPRDGSGDAPSSWRIPHLSTANLPLRYSKPSSNRMTLLLERGEEHN
jgi:hypothetical protein